MMLMKKGKSVGSKGSPKKKTGGAGGRAQRLPPQRTPRKKHIGSSLDGYKYRLRKRTSTQRNDAYEKKEREQVARETD